MYYYDYLIIAAVLILISIIVIRINKKDFSIKINKLVMAFGGKENVISVKENMSRVNVVVKDPSVVDKDIITKLGAKGIVEVDNEFKIILGPGSKKLTKLIKDLK